ncbi:MAG: hypothetical protein K6E68_06115 [Lachnospiraceae bacterium]|nr:hypothetical protein [Lachnospiraceae bacterium]
MDEKNPEQYREKSKIVEEHLPSLQSIKEEYQAQGKTLTDQEAEQIREEIRKDMMSGDINLLREDILETAAGGAGGCPNPTSMAGFTTTPVIQTKLYFREP